MQKGILSKLLASIWCCFIIQSSSNSTIAQKLLSCANVTRSWKNNINIEEADRLFDLSVAKTVLFSQSNATDYPSVGFGFFPQQTFNSYILAIYMGYFEPSPYYEYAESLVLLWSANRDHPVQENATLTLTFDGDLVLRDADGSFVWSTNTSGLLVRSVCLNDNGNLVLLNGTGETIWESFHYSTDTIFLNYPPYPAKGQKLISRISTPNNSTENFTFHVLETSNNSTGYSPVQIVAFVDLNPPQQYRFLDEQTIMTKYHELHTNNYYMSKFVYGRLDQDGHLYMFTYPNNTYENELYLGDLFEDDVFGDCSYPATCGSYGVCIRRDECYCPAGSSDDNFEYFTPKEASNADSGCNLVTPLSCPNTNNLHKFLVFPNVTYFDSTPSLTGTDIESCKTVCLNECSCKAAFFRHFNDPFSGNCTLHTELLTLMDVSEVSVAYKAVAFIKVQKTVQNQISNKKKLVLYLSAGFTALVLIIGVCSCMLIKQRSSTKVIDHCPDVFVKTVGRYSFQSLKSATQDFKTKLGRGGFGSVYEGTLDDGTKVAVKLLESSSQGRKEFLAEVNTIGSFHHFNLVRLIGYCDEGLDRLLVYEYLCNGSLDKWIFNQDISQTLNWNIRRRIIEGVAAGLEYLHEHCKQYVIHFDIKPQNILLDKNFNVKIADFGLAKMLDQDQSQVMTMVRGTRGYMAPELINGSASSVKVDVYSFGVVVLEIVCGRKNFGRSEGDILTILVKAKANEDQLSDLINLHDVDMQQNKEEVVNMMRIAIWCLQPQFIRPNMSKVVKLLQDLSNIDALNDLNDLTMVQETTAEDASYKSKYQPIDSVLSGPR